MNITTNTWYIVKIKETSEHKNVDKIKIVPFVEGPKSHNKTYQILAYWADNEDSTISILPGNRDLKECIDFIKNNFTILGSFLEEPTQKDIIIPDKDTRYIIYRLYGLAEAAYFTCYADHTKEETVTISGQSEYEHDQWTMLKSDYDKIRECAQALCTLKLMKGLSESSENHT